jgi:hypothetical protein
LGGKNGCEQAERRLIKQALVSAYGQAMLLNLDIAALMIALQN